MLAVIFFGVIVTVGAGFVVVRRKRKTGAAAVSH
jgi:LPXTG-motif cell wall-anchored protein